MFFFNNTNLVKLLVDSLKAKQAWAEKKPINNPSPISTFTAVFERRKKTATTIFINKMTLI